MVPGNKLFFSHKSNPPPYTLQDQSNAEQTHKYNLSMHCKIMVSTARVYGSGDEIAKDIVTEQVNTTLGPAHAEKDYASFSKSLS